MRDLRQAIRSLTRWRFGAVAAIATLAIGIGATTSLAAFVRLALMDFAGVPQPDRVARIYASSQALGVERGQPSLQEFEGQISRARSFDALGAYTYEEVAIGSSGGATTADAAHVTPGFFRAFGVPPTAGRVFTDRDGAAAQPVVVLSDALWHRLFPAARLGEATLKVDGVDRVVIGVMPRHFKYTYIGIDAELWLPIAQTAAARPAVVSVVGRLRPGVSWAVAGAELDALGRSKAPWTWRAIPLETDARQRMAGVLIFALGPTVIVLLIACVNVACMLMARGVEREKELAVRRALGASRGRIVAQLLTEHALLAGIAGVIGCALSVIILRVIASQVEATNPDVAAQLSGSLRLLAIALGWTSVACLVFGTIPALRLSRCDVTGALNGVPATHRVQIAGYGARDLIVFAELGTAVGLIVFAAMFFNFLTGMQRVTPLYPADRIVAIEVKADEAEAILSRVASVPGVAGVALASGIPQGQFAWRNVARVTAEGTAAVPMDEISADPALADALGVAVVRGRWFDRSERGQAASVAVLSERAARALEPDGDVVGMQLRVQTRRLTTVTVIGVCRDAMDFGAMGRAGLIAPEFYVPFERDARGALVIARTASDPHALLKPIASAAQGGAATRPHRARIVGDDISERRSEGSIVIDLLGGFAIVALLLAASGVFGVISQSVAQRTREFGIRLALGAAPRRVLAMVLARETKLIGAAIATGVVFTVGLTYMGFLELVRLSATAPSLWIVVGLLCAGIAAIACGLATYRIVRLEPAAVLRRH